MLYATRAIRPCFVGTFIADAPAVWPKSTGATHHSKTTEQDDPTDREIAIIDEHGANNAPDGEHRQDQHQDPATVSYIPIEHRLDGPGPEPLDQARVEWFRRRRMSLGWASTGNTRYSYDHNQRPLRRSGLAGLLSVS